MAHGRTRVPEIRKGDTVVVLTGKDGAAVPLVFGEDVIVGRPVGPAERRVAAPLVFVGYGLVAPEHGRDDYKGLDVAGKIVPVQGEISQPRMGLDAATFASLAADVDQVVHAAASTKFVAPIEQLRRDNVQGTTEVLALTDERGRQVVVPSNKLAYVEIGEPESRRVGFGGM